MVHPHGCVLGVPLPLCPVSGLAGQIASTFLAAVTTWFASTAAWLLRMLGTALDSSTAPPVTTAWFLARQRAVLAAAAPIGLLALLATSLSAVVHGTASELWRTVAVRLPVAVLLGASCAGVVGLAISATDQLSAVLASGGGASLATTLRGLGVAAQASGGLPGGVGVVLTALVIAGSLLLWVELVVRAAAITVATALLPLVFAASLWPPGVVWARRLVETLGALVIAKAAIVLVLSIALDALAHAGAGASTVLTGAAMLLLASFMPYAVLRLVPAFEAAAVSHLETVRHRAAATVQLGSRQAVSMALAGADAGVVAGIDPVGSDPVGMLPGVEGDLIAGTALDPTARFVRGPVPIRAVPASAGTHHWERDDYGPRLVWRPGHDDQR